MSMRDRYPRTRQSRLENWVSETKNCFLDRSFSRGWKKDVASASRRICALASGLTARREETVFRGRRRESGIMDCEVEGASSVSMSRDERPRWLVRCFAVARMEGGVR